MPYFGADAMVQAGRVAVIPGHLGLTLVTAYSVSAERMDPAHWEGSRAYDRRRAAGNAQGARSVLQPGLAAACAVSELGTPAQGLRRAMLGFWKHLLSPGFHPMPCSLGYKALPPQTHLFVVLQC